MSSQICRHRLKLSGLRESPNSVSIHANCYTMWQCLLQAHTISFFIRNADQKRIQQISDEIADFGARARRIRATEMAGASMSISSLGGIGGEAFSPIVNPPEVAILGITRTEMRPIWDGQNFVPRQMVPLDLTYDHRVINGTDVVRFLDRYRYLISNADDLISGIAGKSE